MNAAMRNLSGAALAAAAMYWLDPTSGRRRRARLRDKLYCTLRDLRNAFDVGGRDLAHRMQGLAAQARSTFDDGKVDDTVLAERVRECLGRVVSHPGAIEVNVSEGRVELNGAVLTREYPQLMHAVHSVRGVIAASDQLAVHDTPGRVSALQGGRPRQPPRFGLLKGNGSPAARLLMSATGGGLVLYGVRHRGLPGFLSAAAGGALLARSTMNLPFKQLAGAAGRRAIDIHKTLRVNAPIERVFETLSRYENFPLFMRNVRSVHMHTDGRSRWSVAGPAGITVEWDAVTTRFEPNRLLAWRTVAHAPVQHAGIMRFEPANGGTRLEIQMSYNPPAGVLGHAVAKLFGADPKSELDQDLLRLKSFLETGKLPRDAAAHAAAPHLANQAPPVAGAPESSLDSELPLH